jgi:hypothetical protein
MRYWALNLVHLVLAGPGACGTGASASAGGVGAQGACVFALAPQDAATKVNAARRVVEDSVLLCEHEGAVGKTECFALAGAPCTSLLPEAVFRVLVLSRPGRDAT